MNALKTIAAWVMLTAMATAADAAILKQGETACRNQNALEQLQTARAEGDQHTIGWLLDGAACVQVPEDTQVKVVASTEDGHAQVRTTERRRNVRLWTTTLAVRED